jgi:hypothetical protein
LVEPPARQTQLGRKMINDLMNKKDRANDVGVIGDEKRQTTKEDVQA